MDVLIVQGPTYFSPGDEAAFFAWLQGIPSVGIVRGELRDLHIEIAGERIPDDDLRELIGLLHRYGVDMKGLARFATPANSRWFKSPTAFWHSAVFS